MAQRRAGSHDLPRSDRTLGPQVPVLTTVTGRLTCMILGGGSWGQGDRPTQIAAPCHYHGKLQASKGQVGFTVLLDLWVCTVD